MTPALRFDGVVRAWRGGRRALDGLTFHVPRGAICAFIGPNGAGKTTTFSVVSGFLPPDEGRVDILGEGGFDPWRLKGRLGVLPQDAELPERHTAPELLEHLAVLQGMARPAARREAERRLEQVRLGDRRVDRIGALSHGMRRRVAVATALLGEPELVLLDEPTAGLDPVQAASLRDELAALRGRTTLVVSSHNLIELERLCDWVVMIDRGRCLRQGTVSEVTGRHERLVLETADPERAAAVLALALPDHPVRRERPRGDGGAEVLSVEVPAGTSVDDTSLRVMGALASSGIALRQLHRGSSLEDRFLEASATS